MYQNVPYKRVFVTIDLDAIVFNMESMKQNIKPGTEMMGVVKADGYGHGAVPVAKAMDPYVWGYAAATSEEALQLRAHGITKPVLVLSPVHPSEFQELIREGIRITVFTRDQAEDISKEAALLGKTANIHIAVDTGMSRIGVVPDEHSAALVEEISQMDGIRVEGLFTHFAKADEEEKESTRKQMERFTYFARLLEDVKKVENAGCEYLHIDVMDGHFVPNITLGPNVVKSLRKDVNMVFDAHLMIENPDQYIKEFVDAGCDIIVVHQEACRHLHRTIQNIKSYGIKAGVSLNPATPIETIKHIIRDVDMVLIMTVNPGFGGQSFIESMIPKIEELKMLIDSEGLNVDIQVDGGIKPDNVDKVVRAGANVIVAGSAIFNSDDIKSTVDLFRKNAFAVK